MSYLISIILIAFSALFSGLNLGLMSLSTHELKRKADLGDARAQKIYPIRRNGNLLLVTLLIGNVLVISVLSIFLDSLLPGVIAALLSTLLITIFGEIIPQAIFARFAMELGSRLIWLVQLIIWALYPVAFPLAWVLDHLLGQEEPTYYSRMELIKILEEHGDAPESDIEADEERIARGALSFGDRLVGEVMTPRSQIVGIEESETITPTVEKRLQNSGHSRFIAYKLSLDQIRGILYLHDLIDPHSSGKTVRDLMDKKLVYVSEKSELDHVLNAFLKTKHHLFVVVNEFEEIVGVISIEDVLETILNAEIVGEFDRYEDLRAVARRGKKLDPNS